MKDGKTTYRLAGGDEYKSPTSAAKALTGGSFNGWRFWSVAED